mmetsp:Transcript_132790/g.230251  ORF Transcript_132790/g.230251 Transcript_132790/m.230251 type:complete len:121 (+) Transcript_132790:646-1008(+)
MSAPGEVLEELGVHGARIRIAKGNGEVLRPVDGMLGIVLKGDVLEFATNVLGDKVDIGVVPLLSSVEGLMRGVRQFGTMQLLLQPISSYHLLVSLIGLDRRCQGLLNSMHGTQGWTPEWK